MTTNESPDKPQNLLVHEGDSQSFYRDLAWLINNQLYSDVLFSVDQTNFHGHKCIVATRCQYFKQLFDQLEGGSVCPIDGISAEDFLVILEFVYTNRCIKLNQSNVFDILSAANMYDLTELIKICEVFLIEHLNVERACESIEAAVIFGLDRLFEKSMTYFEDFTLDIFRSDSSKEMSSATVARILESDKLNVDEYEVCMFVKEWATVNSVVLNIPIDEIAKDVTKFIRLPLLTPEELAKIESENSNHFIPVEQISQAWKHIALKTPSRSIPHTTPRKSSRRHTADK